MEMPTLPAARQFADEIRALYAKGLDETDLWRQIAAGMKILLADAGLKKCAKAGR